MEDFERWYRREHPRVLATCVALTGQFDAAGEATDEAFSRALERWPVVGAMVSPGGWVQVVALNHLRRGWRRGQRERSATGAESRRSDFVIGAVPDPELWMVVALLPARQRTATVLRYVHGLPETSIGELMGVSRGTVASTLAAARRNLRRYLSEPPIDPTPVPEEKTTHG